MKVKNKLFKVTRLFCMAGILSGIPAIIPAYGVNETNVFLQENKLTVSGTITDESGLSVIGTNIMEKGTKKFMIISKIFRRGFGPVLLPTGPTPRALIEGWG